MTDGVLKGARRVLLLSALIYPLVVAVIVIMVIKADPFLMFSPPYFVLCFVALPVVWLFVTVRVAAWYGPLPKGWLVFHLLLLGLATFVHFWLVAQFAAGV